MRKRKLYACKCGRWVKQREHLCEVCSPYGGNTNYDEVVNPSFLLTNEISGRNIDIRLQEGFRLLQDY
jgi:hypothetical protein